MKSFGNRKPQRRNYHNLIPTTRAFIMFIYITSERHTAILAEFDGCDCYCKLNEIALLPI